MVTSGKPHSGHVTGCSNTLSCHSVCRMLREIFRHMSINVFLLDIFVLIFLDFLIFIKTEEEHIQHVSRVLQRVIDSKLACNLKKCQFHVNKVEFLGYEVSGRGVNMIDNCVKVIKDWAPPSDLKALQSFLGFCNFYRSFIHDYSKITIPLTHTTKKGNTLVMVGRVWKGFWLAQVAIFIRKNFTPFWH